MTLSNTKSVVHNEMNDAKQFLIDQGFKQTGTCLCGGAYTVKYELKSDNGFVNIKLRRNKFFIANPGKQFYAFPMAELKNKVDEVKRNNKTAI